MTHTVTNTETESRGSVEAVIATVNITSLDAAGSESFAVADEFGISGVAENGVGVRAQESSAYKLAWDHINGTLSVVNVSDGTDVANDTDVGEVVLEFVGT